MKAVEPVDVHIADAVKKGAKVVTGGKRAGLDLPLKALVFEDAAGKVWLSYNDPRWLAKRHGVGAALSQTIDAMASTLDAVAANATKSP
jgi:uncharacterized protein (DUF302 family)